MHNVLNVGCVMSVSVSWYLLVILKHTFNHGLNTLAFVRSQYTLLVR